MNLHGIISLLLHSGDDEPGIGGPLWLLFLRAFEQVSLIRVFVVSGAFALLATLAVICIVHFNRDRLE